MVPRWLVLTLGVALALIGVAIGLACTIGDEASNQKDNGVIDTIEVLAPIDGAEVLTLESSPLQYTLRVVSGLPNGCARFNRYELERSAEVIKVTVWNLMPAKQGVICTQIYGTVEHSIRLGSDFRSGMTYTVQVNNVTKTFTAQ
ncbi:MAG TPA: hypothetical protein VNL15_03790 [Dehalococcoidia bacterium]|nr:hypothetical protein [Dehalococcoidia bacterium]